MGRELVGWLRVVWIGSRLGESQSIRDGPWSYRCQENYLDAWLMRQCVVESMVMGWVLFDVSRGMLRSPKTRLEGRIGVSAISVIEMRFPVTIIVTISTLKFHTKTAIKIRIYMFTETLQVCDPENNSFCQRIIDFMGLITMRP